MKILNIFLAAGCLVLANPKTSRASIIIADWTFETRAVPTGMATSQTYGAADSGLNQSGSSAAGVHASSSMFNDVAGDGSSHSMSVNTWAAGDYWQFGASTANYDTINLSWEQTSSDSGPTSFKLAYSTTGIGVFTDINGGTYAVGTTSWASTGGIKTTKISFDLSSLSDVKNESMLYFRLIDLSNPTAAGTSRVDDFTISGNAISTVPEASTWYAGAGISLLLLGSLVRKIRTQTAKHLV